MKVANDVHKKVKNKMFVSAQQNIHRSDGVERLEAKLIVYRKDTCNNCLE